MYAFTLLFCEWKMSQITLFTGVKFLAWKSGCVKSWTNIMSAEYHNIILPKTIIQTQSFRDCYIEFLITEILHCWLVGGVMIVSNEEQSTLVSRWRGRSSSAQPLHLANTERACLPGSMVVLKLEEGQKGFRQKNILCPNSAASFEPWRIPHD